MDTAPADTRSGIETPWLKRRWQRTPKPSLTLGKSFLLSCSSNNCKKGQKTPHNPALPICVFKVKYGEERAVNFGEKAEHAVTGSVAAWGQNRGCHRSIHWLLNTCRCFQSRGAVGREKQQHPKQSGTEKPTWDLNHTEQNHHPAWSEQLLSNLQLITGFCSSRSTCNRLLLWE